LPPQTRWQKHGIWEGEPGGRSTNGEQGGGDRVKRLAGFGCRFETEANKRRGNWGEGNKGKRKKRVGGKRETWEAHTAPANKKRVGANVSEWKKLKHNFEKGRGGARVVKNLRFEK